MNEQIYEFFMPNINIMGFNSASKIGEQVQNLGGTKALIVTDKNLTGTGIPNFIKENLQAASVESMIWDNTNPNPTDKNVHDGVEAYLKNGCNIIISVGGGSPHDCAKGIRMVVDNGGQIKDFEGLNKIPKVKMPLISINTTSGTGAELTRFCIITDTSRKVKMAIVDWRCTPNISINDPVLTKQMPASLTAATGM